MPIDDLWYSNKLDHEGKRLPTRRHGRGKRYRVRYLDAEGTLRRKAFGRKRDAEQWELEAFTGSTVEQQVRQAERHITFREYAERWRLSRRAGWVLGTRERVDSNLRNHLYPTFGDRRISAITLTSILEWISASLVSNVAKSSLKLYTELLDAILAAAVTDKIITENPAEGVNLRQILRGLSKSPKWIPTQEEVLRLLEVVPERYRAIIWLGAGQGLRFAEAVGVEEGARCLDFVGDDLHVVQQIRYSPSEHGGFYLSEPKAGSTGTLDLDPVVKEALQHHIDKFPPKEFHVVDIISGEPVKRTAQLLFHTTRGNPFTDRTWSREWVKWRTAAGWPTKHGTFHSLRHFLATTLITNHVEPQEVQKQMRHKTLRITLDTYVHWWPKPDRRTGLVGEILRKLADKQ